GPVALQLLEELHPAEAGHAKVDEGDVERPGPELLEGFFGAGRLVEVDLLSRADDLPEDAPDAGIVVHDQQGEGGLHTAYISHPIRIMQILENWDSHLSQVANQGRLLAGPGVHARAVPGQDVGRPVGA